MKTKTYLIIGESCVDVFIYGEAKRLSPEAPVPIFTPINTIQSNGMAANVLANLKSLLYQNEEPHSIIFEAFSESSPIKTRFVDKKSNHIFLRVDTGDDEIERMVIDPPFIKMIKMAETIIISDYNKGFMTEDDIYTILTHTTLKQTTFLDTKKILSKEILKQISFVKLNQPEYENNRNKIGEWLDIYDEKIIITKGGDGTNYMGTNYPVEEKQTIDVSGAGDTFIASLAYYYSKDETIEESIKFANEMASQVVTKRGVSII
jgi:D-beta-D-heptose 7-phosphate kinase/D-beta-D-heptose 1-phosphate adenosyltransferase